MCGEVDWSVGESPCERNDLIPFSKGNGKVNENVATK